MFCCLRGEALDMGNFFRPHQARFSHVEWENTTCWIICASSCACFLFSFLKRLRLALHLGIPTASDEEQKKGNELRQFHFRSFWRWWWKASSAEKLYINLNSSTYVDKIFQIFFFYKALFEIFSIIFYSTCDKLMRSKFIGHTLRDHSMKIRLFNVVNKELEKILLSYDGFSHSKHTFIYVDF